MLFASMVLSALRGCTYAAGDAECQVLAHILSQTSGARSQRRFCCEVPMHKAIVTVVDHLLSLVDETADFVTGAVGFGISNVYRILTDFVTDNVRRPLLRPPPF